MHKTTMYGFEANQITLNPKKKIDWANLFLDVFLYAVGFVGFALATLTIASYVI